MKIFVCRVCRAKFRVVLHKAKNGSHCPKCQTFHK